MLVLTEGSAKSPGPSLMDKSHEFSALNAVAGPERVSQDAPPPRCSQSSVI